MNNPNCVYQFSINGWGSLMHNFKKNGNFSILELDELISTENKLQ